MKKGVIAIIVVLVIVALFYFWDKSNKKKQQAAIDANKAKADQLLEELGPKPVETTKNPVSPVQPGAQSNQQQLDLIAKAESYLSKAGNLQGQLKEAIAAYKAAAAANEFNSLKKAMIELTALLSKIALEQNSSSVGGRGK